MQNSIKVKRTVIIFLLLHTAIILMLAFVFGRGSLRAADPSILAAAVAAAVAITLYTAYRITENINEKIERQAKSMAQYAQYLQTRTQDLDNYAVELKRWASDMNEQQKALQQRVRVINDYGNRMNELVEKMNAPKERPAQHVGVVKQAAYGADRKTG